MVKTHLVDKEFKKERYNSYKGFKKENKKYFRSRLKDFLFMVILCLVFNYFIFFVSNKTLMPFNSAEKFYFSLLFDSATLFMFYSCIVSPYIDFVKKYNEIHAKKAILNEHEFYYNRFNKFS